MKIGRWAITFIWLGKEGRQRYSYEILDYRIRHFPKSELSWYALIIWNLEITIRIYYRKM